MTDEKNAAPVTAMREKENEENQKQVELLTGSNKENETDRNVNIDESKMNKGIDEHNDVEANAEGKIAVQSGDVADQENCDYDKHTDESTKEVLDDIENLLNDEEFIESLNVVDAWEGEDEAEKRKTKERKQKEAVRKLHDKLPDKDNRSFRDKRDKRAASSRERLRHDRRDPSKSNKDIERDKQRSKKDAESKILAEKEKAIKKILDSDTVVPPGTESEAIEKIGVEEESRPRRSRERRRSVDRVKPRSPLRRSPVRTRSSPHRRRSPSPFRYRSPPSSERRRSPRGGYRRRSISPERRSSERRRRIETRERDTKFRRSRTPDRRRNSRTPERRRRYSRSPDHREDRWRSRSRSPTRRGRKRSPFINEIARQLTKDALMSQSSAAAPPQQFLGAPSVSQVAPLASPNFTPAPPIMNSAPYMPYDPSNPTSVNYEPQVMRPMEFASGPPVMYSNSARILVPVPPTGSAPQPVPAPVQTMYNHIRGIPGPPRSPPLNSDNALQSSPPCFKSDEYRPFSKSPSRERLKTPEPPVISDSKLFEKTSLSSLLEASVSAKASSSPAVLYPGFRPEILKNCERALQELPAEDPRLKMTGRFFFDPTVKEPSLARLPVSNSPLLRKGPSKIYWDDEDIQPNAKPKSTVMTHQKICQTEETEVDHKDCQTEIEVASIGIQVYPQDLLPRVEEKRPIQERLDWNKREFQPSGFEIADRREPDLRESLNARERLEGWQQQPPSPPRMPIEPRNFGPVPAGPVHPMDYGHRERPIENPREPAFMDDLYRSQMVMQYDRTMYQMQMAAPIDELERRRIEEFRMEERRMEERRMEERRLEERRLEETMMREEEEMEWQARRNMGGKLGTLYKLRARGRTMRGRGAPYGGNF